MYYFVYGFLYLLSLLPLKVLYLFSDLVFVLIYYIFGYRRKVVRANLNIAFPEKSNKEKDKIEKQFYRNFVDNFIEVLKLISGKGKFAAKHFDFDPTLLNRLYDEGKRVQFHMGHNFNWEMSHMAVGLKTRMPLLLVYMPLKNRIFEKIMYDLRTSTGNTLLPATDMKNAILPYRNSQYLLGLAADQVPGNLDKAYWVEFFGRLTPFVRGPEHGARSANIPVIFAEFYKTGRGKYYMNYFLAEENPERLPPGELTVRYARFLEESISRHPEMWLWSHRRWKRTWNETYEHATFRDTVN